MKTVDKDSPGSYRLPRSNAFGWMLGPVLTSSWANLVPILSGGASPGSAPNPWKATLHPVGLSTDSTLLDTIW